MAAQGQLFVLHELLAAALRGEAPAWPHEADPEHAVERILYHGIAGLIAENAADLTDWPAEVMAPARNQAIAQAMWEIRHKQLLTRLLGAFAKAGITPLLLKGSALAYDLYLAPAARARGDSDLLIAADDLEQARQVLADSGFERGSRELESDELSLQEVWSMTTETNLRHDIDLHWQLLNAPALAGIMQFDDCKANLLRLPKLGPEAVTMSRVWTLLHTCIHRAMHITSPYFVDGLTYYGGDRLIWVKDIDLLSAALSDSEWDAFAASAVRLGVGAVALNGLEMAHRALGTTIPKRVYATLTPVRREPASTYLLTAGQMRRSWADLRATAGWKQKLAYASSRALPSHQFLRSKYPTMNNRPIFALHARRMIELILPRPASTKHR